MLETPYVAQPTSIPSGTVKNAHDSPTSTGAVSGTSHWHWRLLHVPPNVVITFGIPEVLVAGLGAVCVLLVLFRRRRRALRLWGV